MGLLYDVRLHYGRPFVRVEITRPFEPSKRMYVKNIILFLVLNFMPWDIKSTQLNFYVFSLM